MKIVNTLYSMICKECGKEYNPDYNLQATVTEKLCIPCLMQKAEDAVYQYYNNRGKES